MKTAFFGSPIIAANLLEMLLHNKNLEITLVITQPDKPVGRRLQLTPTDVKQLALRQNIPVFDHEIREKALLQELEQKIMLEKYELGILYAYGALIPEKIINLFPRGIWNVHPSLLPLYRGPSPTAYPLLLGDLNTGVTIMKLVKQLDAGPLIAQEQIPIGVHDTREKLEAVLTRTGARLIGDLLDKIRNQVVLTTYTQDPSKSTYTRLLQKKDGYISSDLIHDAISINDNKRSTIPEIIEEYMTKYDIKKIFSASEIVWNMYRAFYPWPGIWTQIETSQGIKRLKINSLHLEGKNVKLDEVQLEGKKPTDFQTFNRAYNFITAR